MEEFITKNFNFITYFVEVLAATTGVLLHTRYKLTEAKYFIYYLVYIVLVEVLGSYSHYLNELNLQSLLEGTHFYDSVFWFTLFFDIGAIVFFSFYYYKILKTRLFKSVLKYGTYLFLVASIIDIMSNWQTFYDTFSSFIEILGACLIILCALFFFIELLQSENVLNFKKNVNFYITVAIFIWWMVITPLVFYNTYHSEADWDFVNLNRLIYLFANIFMYTTFTVGLIVSKPKNEQ